MNKNVIHLTEKDIREIVTRIINEGKLARFLGSTAMCGSLLTGTPSFAQEPKQNYEQTISSDSQFYFNGDIININDINNILSNIFGNNFTHSTEDNITYVDYQQLFISNKSLKEMCNSFEIYFKGDPNNLQSSMYNFSNQNYGKDIFGKYEMENGVEYKFNCYNDNRVRMRIIILIKENKFKIISKIRIRWENSNSEGYLTTEKLSFPIFVMKRVSDVIMGNIKPEIKIDNRWDF